jgi:hypothetical protein
MATYTITETQTVAQRVADAMRRLAGAYASGDQVAPCAVLWPDPERLWEAAMPTLQAMLPELYVLGQYAPERRSGPALWLRCIEARRLDGATEAGVTPIFYLPGVSRAKLQATEECPSELLALVELLYRGAVWLNPSGKEWTPHGFLLAKNGGLGLDVAKDQATLSAVAGALPSLMDEPLARMAGRRLDATFFNGLLAPDTTGLLLRWLSEPGIFRQGRSDAAWLAFCQQCKTEFNFDPLKDDALKAADLLAGRGAAWGQAWQRFCETPVTYAGVEMWLTRAAPKNRRLFDSAEVWPNLNEDAEQTLRRALAALAERPQNEVIKGVIELEQEHGMRRTYVWHKLGHSALAMALAPLAELARLCQSARGAATPEAYADYYAKEGWQVDAAAMATLARCDRPELAEVMLTVVRGMYLPWLEQSARQLQQLMLGSWQGLAKRGRGPGAIEQAAGRLVLFADGLRMDVAQQLLAKLAEAGIEAKQDWEWSSIPAVTATAKPAASPLASGLEGAEAGDEFRPRLSASKQLLTQDRFVTALQGSGWQYLRAAETGEPSGSAWTEAGALDRRGHDEGWKLTSSIEREVRDVASRITALLNAGWAEVVVVTDHGWLLMPGGLPKVELKAFLTDTRWGRCAMMKADAQSEVMAFEWHWNPSVRIASPAGVGCYKAGMEYAHGGVSLQELVTPVLWLKRTSAVGAMASFNGIKWSGARCRVLVKGDVAGLRVDIRRQRADAASSLASDRQAQAVLAGGKATLLLEDEGDLGTAAEIVLLDANGQVIDVVAGILGE